MSPAMRCVLPLFQIVTCILPSSTTTGPFTLRCSHFACLHCSVFDFLDPPFGCPRPTSPYLSPHEQVPSEHPTGQIIPPPIVGPSPRIATFAFAKSNVVAGLGPRMVNLPPLQSWPIPEICGHVPPEVGYIKPLPRLISV